MSQAYNMREDDVIGIVVEKSGRLDAAFKQKFTQMGQDEINTKIFNILDGQFGATPGTIRALIFGE